MEIENTTNVHHIRTRVHVRLFRTDFPSAVRLDFKRSIAQTHWSDDAIAPTKAFNSRPKATIVYTKGVPKLVFHWLSRHIQGDFLVKNKKPNCPLNFIV